MSEEQSEGKVPDSSERLARWLPVATILLLCAVGFAGLLRERGQARRLAASNAEMSALLNQARGQLAALSAKVNGLSAAAAPAPVSVATKAPRTAARHRPANRPAKPPRVVEDPRWKQIQTEFAEHKVEMAGIRNDLGNTRSKLEDDLKSTPDSLTTSIAKTDEEVAALKKRGERNYYKFDLAKSKHFQRIGPINVSLRKADTKHERYDATLLVDDFELSKKRVNLYEPVLIYPAESQQSLELVVNRIDKNQVHGYVSEPKCKPTVSAIGPATGTESSSPSHAEANLAHRSEPLR